MDVEPGEKVLQRVGKFIDREQGGAVGQQLVVVHGQRKIAVLKVGQPLQRGPAVLQGLLYLRVVRLVQVYLYQGPGKGLEEIQPEQLGIR
ncbi:MAG TPA: hypothetical protein DCZ92_02815 [Elusimicrobia bacterium]|nr:hypothetical protein [Elusimicrobiota bacterium]